MIPIWKLKREIKRFEKQILGICDLVLARPRRVIYDLLRPLLCRVTQGQMQPGPHMAVFLLYQPKGLSASVQVAIGALLDSGAVPIFISNLPLNAGDRAYLAGKSWRVVERPNAGYDFGGYREGITQIFDTGLDPDQLWILNDSAWFPVCDGDQPLARLIDDSADVSGAMVHMDGRDHDKDYAESYFLAFPKSTIRHPAFVKFERRAGRQGRFRAGALQPRRQWGAGAARGVECACRASGTLARGGATQRAGRRRAAA